MVYETIVGRSRKDFEKFGSAAAGFIGKHIVGTGEDAHLTTRVMIDLMNPHVVLITGKRGTGKSYDAGVIAEEIANLPEEHRRNLAVVFIDTMGIFWSMKTPNNAQISLLSEWKLNPAGFEDVKVYVPYAQIEEYEKVEIPIDGGISIAPYEFSAEEWRMAFNLIPTEPAGIALEKNVNKLAESGEKFNIDDIISKINDDEDTTEEVKDALENMLIVAAQWGVFGTEGTDIGDIVTPGGITVIDVSHLRATEAWSVRNLIVAIIARKLYNRRLMARKEEEVSKIAGETEEHAKKGKKSFPMTWLIIDECLPHDSKVITNKGEMCIGDLVIKHQKGESFKVIGYDRKNGKYGFYDVTHSFILEEREILELTTESGNKIKCTPNHLILTREGFLPAINVPEVGLMPERVYSHDRKLVMSRLAGCIMGDGWISSNMSIGFSGKGLSGDLELIRNDLRFLGLNSSNVYTRPTESKITREDGTVLVVEGISQSINASTNAYRLFHGLGLPVGDKAITEFILPQWIANSSKEEKCEFLAALMGSDGMAASPMKSAPKCFGVFRLSFNKSEKLKRNAFDYANQLEKMFADVGVKVSSITRRKGNMRKDGTKTIKIVITLSNSLENQIAFLENIGFRYCEKKEIEASKMLFYLKAKKEDIKRKKKLFDKTKELHKKGSGSVKISHKLGVPPSRVKYWLYRSKGRVWVSDSFPSYKEWCKSHYQNDIVYEKVVKRDCCKKEEVYDISVDKVHNFVSNNFIVHNCHNFAPSDRRAVSTDPLTMIAKQGREPGVSLVVMTQMPNKIHQDILSQCDLVIAHRLTSRDDLEALHSVMQTYMEKELWNYINSLPRWPGAAILLDDNLEKVFTVQIRPRISWHAGGTAAVI